MIAKKFMYEFYIITMKINNLDISKFMVTRKYKHAKRVRNLSMLASAINLKVGINNAMSHQLPNMLISYGCTCLCAKIARDCHMAVKALEPTYQSIVKRAKQIYKHK